MFRSERLDFNRPALSMVADAAFTGLKSAGAQQRGAS
jgi:hypothetical protein